MDKSMHRPDLNVVGSALADIFELHENRGGYCHACGGQFPCLTVSSARLAWEEIGRAVDYPEDIPHVRVTFIFDMEETELYRLGGDDFKRGSWTSGSHHGITCESVAASVCGGHDARLGYIGFQVDKLPGRTENF